MIEFKTDLSERVNASGVDKKKNALSGAFNSGSGAGIRTPDLQVMSSSPKTGALDRQAGFPRVA